MKLKINLLINKILSNFNKSSAKIETEGEIAKHEVEEFIEKQEDLEYNPPIVRHTFGKSRVIYLHIFNFFQKRILIILALILVILTTLIVYSYLKPEVKARHLFISNLSESQAAITWVSNKNVKAELIISRKNEFLPFVTPWTKDLLSDIRQTESLNSFKTHYFLVKGLSPSTSYSFAIYHNGIKVREGEFKTGPKMKIDRSKYTIGGKVLSSDGKNSISGAIVYYFAKLGDQKSALLSAITNQNGDWTMNLGPLRDSNLTKAYKIKKNHQQLLIVDGSNLGAVKISTMAADLKKWPSVLLKAKGK